MKIIFPNLTRHSDARTFGTFMYTWAVRESGQTRYALCVCLVSDPLKFSHYPSTAQYKLTAPRHFFAARQRAISPRDPLNIVHIRRDVLYCKPY